jgi:predicted esterase
MNIAIEIHISIVDQLIRQEIASGTPSERILVGGFSQGTES